MIAHLQVLETLEVSWPDEAACAAFATRLAHRLAAEPALRDAYIALTGPLGAGKTTFVRHLLRALGVQGRIKSPSYALLEPYCLPDFEVSHLDFYRFDDAREWVDAGLRDVFAAPGLKLAEWPEKAAALLPEPDLTIAIEPFDDQTRSVTVTPHTELGAGLLA